MDTRQREVADVSEAVPLMYSAGPESFRYVFSVDYENQALDFLRYAFCTGKGEFGYMGHQVAIKDGKIVGLVGRRSAKENTLYTVAAIKQILKFYPLTKALGVLIRGLRFEAIVKPPIKNVICLHNLAVSAEQQGAGIGQEIIENFIKKEQRQGTLVIGLNVAETNPRAKALYERLGFVVKGKSIGRLKSKYGRGVSHEYMEINISH